MITNNIVVTSIIATMNRVYALSKKEENFGRIEILPFCSKKSMRKNCLEEFPLLKY